MSVDRQALIEEARRKARRRRLRNGAVVLLAVGVGVAAFMAFGGQGGSSGGAAQAVGGQGAAASLGSALLPRLPADTEVSDYVFDARAPNTLYVAAIDWNGNVGRVYKSSDSGGHWRPLLRSRWPVLTLTADPQHPGTLYAGTERGIFKTLDDGRHWRAVSSWPLSTGPYRLTVDPGNSQIVWESSGSGLSRSSDGGHHWKPVFRTFAQAGDRRVVAPTIAFAPSNPKDVYVLTGFTTLAASSDGGKTWQDDSVGYAGSGGVLPGISSAAKDSTHGAVLAVDPQNPKTLYVAVGHAVVMSSDAGKHWRSITRGLGFGTTSFAFDPRHPGTVYAAEPDGIFKTTSAGHTWNIASLENWINTLAIDPAHPSTIYAASGRQIAKSTNNGRTWTTQS